MESLHPHPFLTGFTREMLSEQGGKNRPKAGLGGHQLSFPVPSPQKSPPPPRGLPSFWTGQRSMSFQGADLKSMTQRSADGKLGRGDPHTLEVTGSFHPGGDRGQKVEKTEGSF